MRSVTTHDPEWLPEDTAEALAFDELERETCSGCGMSLTETLDRDADGAYTVEALRCHACAAKARAARKFGPDDSAGLILYARR